MKSETGRNSASLTEVAQKIVEALEEDRLKAGFSVILDRGAVRGKGSASGVVQVVYDPNDPGNELLVVRMAFMRTPDERREEFFEDLLTLNNRFLGRAAFAVSPDGRVWLHAARPVEDLDPGEALDLVLWTADFADILDDPMLEKYGREWAP